MKRLAIVCLALVAFALPLAGQPKYGVTSTADKATDFTKLKTYVWQTGFDAPDKTVHAAITAAIDKELAALGFQKKASAPSDVVVKYATLRRIDVQPSTKTTGAANPTRSQVDVGSLQLQMLNPADAKELWKVRIDKPVEVDMAKMEATVNSIVAEIFTQYPTRVVKKK
jgi:hypothetical protein